MIKSIVLALVASLTAANAQRIFLFDATRCNTNWNEAENWEGGAIPTATSNLVFGASTAAPSAPFVPVNLLIRPGQLTIGRLTLKNGASITLPRDGAVITMGQVDAPPVHFISGQTPRATCSMGCSSNWRMANDPGAALNPAAVATLPAATDLPNVGDTMLIPFGFHPALYAWGVHTANRLGYVSSNRTIVYAENKAAIPNGFTNPQGPQLELLMDPQEAQATCGGQCSSMSRCIIAGTGDPERDLNIPFVQADIMRTRAASSAVNRLGAQATSQGSFTFTYTGLSDTLGAGHDACAAAADTPQAFVGSLASAAEAMLSVGSTTEPGSAPFLPKDCTLSGLVFAGMLDADDAFTGEIRVTGQMDGSPLHLYNVAQQLSGAPFDAAVRPGPLEGRIYYAILDAIIGSYSPCMSIAPSASREDVVAEIKARAGLQVQTLSIFVGNHLPQMDIEQLVNEANKPAFALHMQQLISSNGMKEEPDTRNTMMLRPSMTVEGPDRQMEIQNAARAFRGRRTLNHLYMPNHGSAIAKVLINLNFQAYGAYLDTPADDAVTAFADTLAASYVIQWPRVDPANNRFCINLPSPGYNFTCIVDAIDDVVEEAMSAPEPESDCATFGYSSDECVVEARGLAAEEWSNIVDCGSSGRDLSGAGCADPIYGPTGPMFMNISNVSITERSEAIFLASQEGDDDEGISMIMIIAAGAAVVVLCIIIIAVVMVGGDSNDEGMNRETRATNIASFENPMYGGAGAMDLTGAGDGAGLYDNTEGDGDGLYDEPELQSGAGVNPLYGTSTEDEMGMGGYLDIEQDGDESDDGDESSDDDDEGEYQGDNEVDDGAGLYADTGDYTDVNPGEGAGPTEIDDEEEEEEEEDDDEEEEDDE